MVLVLEQLNLGNFQSCYQANNQVLYIIKVMSVPSNMFSNTRYLLSYQQS